MFSFIGYTTQEVEVSGQSVIDITLLEDLQSIDEVVVIGFGTKRKENITGATSFVKMDQIISDRPLVNAEEALQGME